VLESRSTEQKGDMKSTSATLRRLVVDARSARCPAILASEGSGVVEDSLFFLGERAVRLFQSSPSTLTLVRCSIRARGINESIEGAICLQLHAGLAVADCAFEIVDCPYFLGLVDDSRASYSHRVLTNCLFDIRGVSEEVIVFVREARGNWTIRDATINFVTPSLHFYQVYSSLGALTMVGVVTQGDIDGGAWLTGMKARCATLSLRECHHNGQLARIVEHALDGWSVTGLTHSGVLRKPPARTERAGYHLWRPHLYETTDILTPTSLVSVEKLTPFSRVLDGEGREVVIRRVHSMTLEGNRDVLEHPVEFGPPLTKYELYVHRRLYVTVNGKRSAADQARGKGIVDRKHSFIRNPAYVMIEFEDDESHSVVANGLVVEIPRPGL
jgi:hypothetical protein